MCTDSLTAEEGRISYGQILIDLNVTQPLPEVMFIEEPNGTNREQRWTMTGGLNIAMSI